MWEPGKPSQNENEYFARRDAEWLKQRRAELDAAREKKQGTMLTCPRCTSQLDERILRGVTVDVCPKCHGVWLDSGELTMLAHVTNDGILGIVHELDPTQGKQ